eukprot:2419926-Rhodomonas_salina.1
MSGTELGHLRYRICDVQLQSGCRTWGEESAIGLRACYAMSGTDIGYGATQCPVLTLGMLLRGVRY